MLKQLMYKDSIVAEFIFENKTNFNVKSIKLVHNEKLMPCASKEIDLSRWFLTRRLALTREDLISIRKFYGAEKFEPLHYRSINDFYWIKDAKDKITWEEINPRKNWNPSEDEIYKSLSNPTQRILNWTNNSPNLTISGSIPKFWFKEDNKIVLYCADAQNDMNIYKTAVANNLQEVVLQREYTIFKRHIYTIIYSDIINTDNLELFPFKSLYYKNIDQNLSDFENFCNICNKYEIPNWKAFIKKLSVLDSSVENEERDILDLYLIRNSDDLSFLGFAKI